MAKESSSSGGIGFFGLLQVLFIGLKLTHYINWSWTFVLLPTLIPIGFALGIMLFMLTVLIIKALVE